MHDSLDGVTFRRVMSNYPTGVAVITGLDADGAVGMTVGTFSSVSLEPPLVSFMPSKQSASFARLRELNGFAVNILSADQVDLCRRFARPGVKDLEGTAWRPSPVTGSPVFDGVIAVIDCRLAAVHEAGDHYIAVGSVEDLQVCSQKAPLLFFQGAYGSYTSRSFAPGTEQDIAAGLIDIQASLPALRAFAGATRAEISVLKRVGNEVVTIAAVGTTGHDEPERIGLRYPLTPPLGELFIAFSSVEDVELWLGRCPAGDESFRTVLEERLRRARVRRWSLFLSDGSAQSDWVEAVAEYGRSDVMPDRDRELSARIAAAIRSDDVEDMPQNQLLDVQHITVPVPSMTGRVEMELHLSALPTQVDRSTIDHLISGLVDLAESVNADPRTVRFSSVSAGEVHAEHGVVSMNRSGDERS